MLFHCIGVEALRRVQAGVSLHNSDDFGAFFVKDAGKLIADVAEALHDHSLAFDAGAQVGDLAERFVVEQLSEDEEAAHSCRFRSAVDAALAEELAGRAACGVDLLFSVDVVVGILDPGHFLLARAHVGSKHIVLWSNERLLGKLHGVLAGYLLQLSLRVLAGIDSDAAFGTSKWNIGHSQLERHQCRESYGLLECDSGSVASTTLNRHEMMLVLCSVARKRLNFTGVTLYWDLETKNVITSHEILEEIWRNGCPGRRPVHKELYLLQEPWLGLFFLVLKLNSANVSSWKVVSLVGVEVRHRANRMIRILTIRLITE